MYKGIYFFCFLFAFYTAKASDLVNTDSLTNILQVRDPNLKIRLVVKFVDESFNTNAVRDASTIKSDINRLFNKLDPANRLAYSDFTESVFQQKLSHQRESEDAIVKAIQTANKNNDWLLSYVFLNHLARSQTDAGNVIGAVSSFGMAANIAVKLNDPNLQLETDLNISNAFQTYGFYSQSLFYLTQAQTMISRFKPADQRIKDIIYYSNAEIFFNLNNKDSLSFYIEKLNNSSAKTMNLFTYKNRAGYYLCMLQGNYRKAINIINAMRTKMLYLFDDGDLRHLADALYKDGQLDSAKLIINELLAKPTEKVHPETKYHLYEMLGEIADQQNDYKSASNYLKLSIRELQNNLTRLTQVDNIAALIKVDEVQEYYTQKSVIYKQQRMWLTFAVIVTLLVILVIAISYRSLKQKRYYENLLFTAKKQELAFINSHDVRRHLANILGLIELIKNSENRAEEYFQTENYLLSATQALDDMVKRLSEKLEG
ncbi:MAG: hypothetical protein WC615_00570 [Mucilaginibacter sp.]|jgi:hypothetical protein|uniref:hypothetical protein n=1 Tax=Mucilaginibacter sp. TaxID=1882438 RepID=UPI0035613FBB